ncbi:MAG: DUF3467 domain-containing protein [Planctomycetota bacterium]
MSEEQFDPKEPPRTHLSARLPESVGTGVFASAISVMGSPNEMVLDFLQTLVQPAQVVARVVLAWQTVPRIAGALKINLENHERRFGSNILSPEPAPPATEPQQNQEGDNAAGANEGAAAGSGAAADVVETRQVDGASFYDDLKFDDNVLRGSYANGAMINHTEYEFKIDFLLHLTPYPVVTSRVFLTGVQTRRLLKSLEDHLARRQGDSQ